MDKNKQNKPTANDEKLDIKFTKSSDQAAPLATKKTPEQIEKDEIKIVSADGVQNASDNINSDVGKFKSSFDNKANAFEDDIVMDDKSKQLGSIREQDKKINFLKFTKTKRNKILAPAKGKFGIWVDTLLRNNRTLLYVWLAAIIAIVVCLSFTISFACCVTILYKDHPSISFFNFKWMQNTAIAANSFSYMSMAFTFLPLLYLLITILVGINGVYKSRPFHYFLWICLITAFVFMIVSLILSSVVISYENSFIRPKD